MVTAAVPALAPRLRPDAPRARTPPQLRPPVPHPQYYPPPVGPAQGGRGPGAPYTHSGHHGYAAPGFAPPPPVQPAFREPGQPALGGTAASQWAPAGSIPVSVRAHLGPPPWYTAQNAPSFPTTVEELQLLMDVAEHRTTAGLHAITKIRFWRSQRQGQAPQNAVEQLLHHHRIPQWYRDDYDGSNRVSKSTQRARLRETGAIMPRPAADAAPADWIHYLQHGPEPQALMRHVRRDPSTGEINALDLRGYLMASRMATVDSPTMTTSEKRRARQDLLRLLALLFTDAPTYAGHLHRLGCTPSDVLLPLAYPGPFPSSFDDVARHATRCGVSPGCMEPELASWAAFHQESVPPLDVVAQPIQPPTRIDDEAPVHAADGSGASAPGGDYTTHPDGLAPPGTSNAASTQDVTMQGI
ncbi:hypothetical protein C2E23DRAFT_889499 [Lenzites betulinus]|nr:hypothetical protein C2E23DRAFT_889499 [Lenzites betulinus]